MPIGIVCRSVPRQAAGCSLLRRFPSTPAYRRTKYVLPERGPHRTMEIPEAHPCRHAKGAKWRSAGAEPCDPHRYLVGIQKMEEGDVRGRVVPRKRAVELGTFGYCPEGKKKKRPIAQDPTTRSRHGMEPEHVARGTTLAVVEDTRKRSLSRYSPAPKTSWGWRVEVWCRRVGSMGPRARAFPPGEPTPGLSLGGTSCALCGSSSRRVLRLSHRVGFAGLFSTTAVFSPCFHLALAAPLFLGRGYGML